MGKKESVGALVVALLAGAVGYSLVQVRSLQSELLELRASVDRAGTRTTGTAGTPVAAAQRAVPGNAGEVEALREEVAQLRGELRRAADASAPLAEVATPAGDAVGSVPTPALATAAPEKMGRILDSLESQDQTLLKGVVKEILEQNEIEEREARRRRQSEEMVRQLAQNLELTPQQTERVTALMQERLKQIEDLRGQPGDQNRDEMRGKIEAIRKQGEEQLATILTADQMAKYLSTQGQRGDGRFGWSGGMGGPGGGGRGPGGTGGNR